MRYLAAMANEAGAVNLLQPQVKNLFAAMQAAGQASASARCWPTSRD